MTLLHYCQHDLIDDHNRQFQNSLITINDSHKISWDHPGSSSFGASLMR